MPEADKRKAAEAAEEEVAPQEEPAAGADAGDGEGEGGAAEGEDDANVEAEAEPDMMSFEEPAETGDGGSSALAVAGLPALSPVDPFALPVDDGDVQGHLGRLGMFVLHSPFHMHAYEKMMAFPVHHLEDIAAGLHVPQLRPSFDALAQRTVPALPPQSDAAFDFTNMDASTLTNTVTAYVILRDQSEQIGTLLGMGHKMAQMMSKLDEASAEINSYLNQRFTSSYSEHAKYEAHIPALKAILEERAANASAAQELGEKYTVSLAKLKASDEKVEKLMKQHHEALEQATPGLFYWVRGKIFGR